MKRHDSVFVRVKVLTVEVASTIIFVAVVCYATYWELSRLLGR
jgi:hypothetical protein